MLLEGLVDADVERRILGRVARGLVLHGHLHRRMNRPLMTANGVLHAVGATSASMLHEDRDRMAGFNLYEIATDGAVERVGAQRFVPDSGTFVDTPVPVVSSASY